MSTQDTQALPAVTPARHGAARFFAFILAVCAAVALFAFGSFVSSHSVLVDSAPAVASTDSVTASAPAAAVQPTVVAKKEPDIVRDVTVGGLTRLPGGAIKQTYSTTPASACPT